MAVNAFNMNLQQLRNILIYGFKRNFYPADYRTKRKYVRHIIDYFDAVLEKHQALQKL